MKRHKIKQILTTLLIILIYSHKGYGQTAESHDEILFISSYNIEGTYVQSNISAFVDTYIHLKGKLNPVTENLNCTTFDKCDTWIPNIKRIIERHKNTKAIVLIGSEAWMSYFSLTEDKYKEIPLFCIMGTRMNYDFASKIDKNKNDESYIDIHDKIKGFNVKLCIYYDYNIKKEFQLIKTFFPNTKNIAIISDNTFNGISHMNYVNGYFKKECPEIKRINISGKYQNLDSALITVSKLPSNTAGILCIWRFDKDGIFYMNNAEYAFKKMNHNFPVFSLTGTGIGNWAIGGYIPNYRTFGNEIAERVNQIIDKKINLKPYITGLPHQYKFDLQALKENDLLDVSLPTNTVYVNAELSAVELFNMYKWYFILTIIIIIVLSISIITLMYYNLHIRKLKNNIVKIDDKLREEQNTLIKSQKELLIAKNDAEEANKMKSTFVSNMSHEIRTPLNAILGFSDVLVSSIEPTEEQKQIVDIIRNNTDILLKLVNDILYISRMEANRMEFKFEKCNIIPYIESTVASAGLNAKSDVKVIFEKENPEMIACTDIIRLQQVITNLVNNATKFTDKGTISIDVKYDVNKSNIIFSVTDTGCGVPLEEQKYIFDRFKKVNEFVQGTGLGLSICKLTVEKLGGEIWVDSSYTTGARFIFTIPIEQKENATNQINE